jgi:hypothetical protein
MEFPITGGPIRGQLKMIEVYPELILNKFPPAVKMPQ